MNKLNPRNKICYNNNKKLNVNLNILKIKKKKWNFFKKILLTKQSYIKIQSEEKKKFFKDRLISKQDLKYFYGCINEYKIKNIIKNLNKNQILQDFVILLETRIDVVLFRANITKSIFQAKQLINHGKIKINDKIVYSSNYNLKKGDIISFNNYDIDFLKINKINYLEINNFLKILIFLRKPFFREIEYPFFLNLKSIYEYFK